MLDFIVKMNSNITELETEVPLALISLVRLNYLKFILISFIFLQRQIAHLNKVTMKLIYV